MVLHICPDRLDHWRLSATQRKHESFYAHFFRPTTGSGFALYAARTRYPCVGVKLYRSKCFTWGIFRATHIEIGREYFLDLRPYRVLAVNETSEYNKPGLYQEYELRSLYCVPDRHVRSAGEASGFDLGAPPSRPRRCRDAVTTDSSSSSQLMSSETWSEILVHVRGAFWQSFVSETRRDLPMSFQRFFLYLSRIISATRCLLKDISF